MTQTKDQQLPVRRQVQDLLEANKRSLEQALPRHITPDRMIRVVLTALTCTPLLSKCTVPSILRAVVECSQLGLEPDGILGYAYLIPFRNKRGEYEAKMIPGYKGYLSLARRSGQLRSLDVDVVREKDHFEHCKGTDPKLVHIPPLTGDRGEIIAAYACARLADQGVQFEVLNLEQINKIKASSRATGDDSPWASHFEAMAKKTAIRQLAKYLPLSPEFQRAAARDEYIEAGIDTGDVVADGDLSDLMAAATDARKEDLKAKYADQDKRKGKRQSQAGDVHEGQVESETPLPPDDREAPEPGSAG